MQVITDKKNEVKDTGADPGFFFLGGGALVTCSTSTPINHIVFFFAEYRRSSPGGGVVRTPCTLLDTPLGYEITTSYVHCLF